MFNNIFRLFSPHSIAMKSICFCEQYSKFKAAGAMLYGRKFIQTNTQHILPISKHVGVFFFVLRLGTILYYVSPLFFLYFYTRTRTLFCKINKRIYGLWEYKWYRNSLLGSIFILVTFLYAFQLSLYYNWKANNFFFCKYNKEY